MQRWLRIDGAKRVHGGCHGFADEHDLPGHVDLVCCQKLKCITFAVMHQHYHSSFLRMAELRMLPAFCRKGPTVANEVSTA